MKLTPSKPPLGPLATPRSLWYNVNCKSVLQDNDGWQEHSIQKTSADRTLSGTIPPAAAFGNYGTIQLACVFSYEKDIVQCRQNGMSHQTITRALVSERKNADTHHNHSACAGEKGAWGQCPPTSKMQKVLRLPCLLLLLLLPGALVRPRFGRIPPMESVPGVHPAAQGKRPCAFTSTKWTC